MNLQQIIARLAEIRADVETRGDQLTAEELASYETETNSLREQRTQLENAAAQRRSLLDSIAEGTRGVTIETNQRGIQHQEPEDPRATMEYRRAFMAYCRTGVMDPILQRADAVTTTTDVSAAVPTTILNEVIRKLESRGQLYSRVRKTSIAGGVQVPVATLKPTASWISETQSSDRQKVQAQTANAVIFTYFGLECKVSQSLIASIVTIDAFETAITDMIVEAMIAKLEAGIIKGTGSGQMLGVTVDTRIPVANVVTITSANFGKWEVWKKQVFAKMPLAYKAKASFIMASGTWEGYIDGMVDTTGQPIARVNYGITDGIQERFGSKEVIQVEDDIIAPYDSAATGDVVAVFMPLGDYCINSNMQLSMRRYFDEDKNEWVDKAILIADGKVLDPNGVIIVKKGA